MLSRHIAEKIQSKVTGLVSQPLSVTEPQGIVMASNDNSVEESIDLSSKPWAIGFSYNGRVAGYVVLSQQLPNHDEIAPLIRSISELMLHQALLIEQIPKQEERLDKFIYDLLNNPQLEERLVTAEARLFEIDLDRPRIAIVIEIDDPSLASATGEPGSDREVRISRYKQGIARALASFYTSSRDNVVVYLGRNYFCILKDLQNGSGQLQTSLDNFKKSINTIYEIIKSETKSPTTVGVGNYHPGIKGITSSYREAMSAIELGAQMWDRNRIYHIDDFGVVAPLLSGVDESNIYFSRELLEKLGQNAEIIQTLEAFFELDMSLTRTAEILNIHRNTLVYRLDRISELLGLDPRVFDDAVQIKLAILFTKFVENDYAAS